VNSFFFSINVKGTEEQIKSMKTLSAQKHTVKNLPTEQS
jgi:hypothetical protein